MERCDIHDLLPYGGDRCLDCGTAEDATIVVGRWRQAVAASRVEEPQPLVIKLA